MFIHYFVANLYYLLGKTKKPSGIQETRRLYSKHLFGLGQRMKIAFCLVLPLLARCHQIKVKTHDNLENGPKMVAINDKLTSFHIQIQEFMT